MTSVSSSTDAYRGPVSEVGTRVSLQEALGRLRTGDVDSNSGQLSVGDAWSLGGPEHKSDAGLGLVLLAKPSKNTHTM